MKKVKCRNCYNYCNEWCELTLDDKYPDIDRDCQYFREKTNADHIRSMTDEELADLLHDYYCEGHADGLHHIYGAMTISVIREWLKQPYKEDT